MKKIENIQAGTIADLIESYRTLMTVEQLAPLLAYKIPTIYAKVAAGTLPAIRDGGSIRFDPFTVATWLRGISA